MRRWVAVLALLVSACSQAASPIASSSPTASATPAASATPVAVTTPVPDDLPLAKVDFSCHLPVLRTPGASYLGGFVTFPAATFAFDPKGGIHSDQSGVFSTDAAPVLHGAGVTSPAWPFTTWLSTAGCRPVHHSPLPKALVTPTPPGTR